MEAIFPEYQGKYNKREVGIRKKGTYVNFSLHDSIEFRIAPLTFEYETLLDWIIKCNKFVSELIYKCHLDSAVRSNESKRVIKRSSRRLSDYLGSLATTTSEATEAVTDRDNSAQVYAADDEPGSTWLMYSDGSLLNSYSTSLRYNNYSSYW